MLLPMCLQDSKSDLIQRNGASMSREKSLDGKESKSRGQEHPQVELSTILAWLQDTANMSQWILAW